MAIGPSSSSSSAVSVRESKYVLTDIEKQQPESILNISSQEEGSVYDGCGQENEAQGQYQQRDDAENSNPDIVSRILSRITSKASVDPGPPPDGGIQAWITVACGHLTIMITWGFITSYGVFQTYYTELLSRPPSDIAWIGSVQVFLTFFVGTLSGRLTDAGYFRLVFLVGSFFLLLGIFATSWCTTYWQIFLAQGVCMGLGEGCLFCPTLTVLATYFSKRRALAIGILACGSSTGGLIFPAVVRELLPRVGFAWTIRVIGFVQLACLLVSNAFMKTRIPPRRNGRFVEWAAFRELEYMFYAAATFFCFWGVYFAFYFLASFARDVLNPPIKSYVESLNLLLILNGVGIIGRTVPNHFADKFGPLNMFAPISFVAGLLVLCWIAVDSIPGLYVWSVVYGIVAAAIQSLFPAALSSLTDDLTKMGVRMGMIFTIVSFSVLTGPPIQGAIISAQGGSYVGAQLFSGLSLLVGCGFLVASRVARSRKRGKGWKDKV